MGGGGGQICLPRPARTQITTSIKSSRFFFFLGGGGVLFFFLKRNIMNVF